MPFPTKNLNDGEEMMLDVHPHWLFYGKSGMLLAGSMMVTVYLLGKTSGFLETAVRYLGVAAIVVSAAMFIVQVVKWRTTYFVVTNQRLIDRQGVLARSGVELPVRSVDNVNFRQTIFERLFGVGRIEIESGGEDSKQVIPYVSRPEDVQKIIHDSIHRFRGRTEFEGAPSFSGVARELERLEALRDRGTITEEEFESQKRRLLD